MACTKELLDRLRTSRIAISVWFALPWIVVYSSLPVTFYSLATANRVLILGIFLYLLARVGAMFFLAERRPRAWLSWIIWILAEMVLVGGVFGICSLIIIAMQVPHQR